MDDTEEKLILLDIDNMTQDIVINPNNLMHLYKLVQAVSAACDKNVNVLKKLVQKYSVLEKVEILQLLIKNDDFILSTTESKKKFKDSVMSSLLKVCYLECRDKISELFFFATATFNIPKVKEIIKRLKKEELNQTRCSDSVLIFTLKYGDLKNKSFLETMEVLLDADIDINKSDANGKFAIDYIAILYKKTPHNQIREELKKLAELLLIKRICRTEEATTQIFLEDLIDLTSYKFALLDFKTRLFYWIAKYKINEFLSFKKIRHFVNCDNGENTLLQFAVNKSQNMLPVVEFLLKNGSDPNKVTNINLLTPLEIAARNNYEAIFKLILNWKETKLTEEQFCNFVKSRGFSVKREYFSLILESDKLDPTFVYKRTKNTPLHYAIRLCHKNAIQKLLKRPDVSLTVENNAGKCPLDILNPIDLNIYLDSCLVFDSRKTIDFNSTEYKMMFRFRRLTDGNLTEVDVISQIGKYYHLEHLLAHPLIHTYVMLKWYKVKFYFWTILIVQALLFLTLSIFFYRYPYSPWGEHVACFVFSVLNIVLKCWVFLRPKQIWQGVKTCSIRPTTLHEYSEILLMITSIGSFCLKEFRAFVFIEMAIVFLLTAGYHPKLSRWSIMLQIVFRTFTKLLIFFSLLMIGFAASFHIMFEEHRFFTALYRSVFMSYFMTIGEINVSEVDFETTPFGGYLLFFLFAMSMSVVIINFWTGVAIKDIDKFEKRAQINALKNVIAFLGFVEKNIYSANCCKRILPNPLLFPDVSNENYVVDFFVNKNDQFEYKYGGDQRKNKEKPQVKRRFPKKIDRGCFEKIKLHYYKQSVNTNEQKILAKLDKILGILVSLTSDKKEPNINKIYKRQNTVI